MRAKFLTSFLTLGLGATGAAFAHHSQIEFNLDPAAIETIVGTVTQYDFVNPHVYVYLETETADGATALWELEASSTPNLIRRGWSGNSVTVGQELTVDIHPPKAPGRHVARISTMYFDDGSRLAVRGEGGIPPPATPDARAETLSGRWLGRWGLPQVSFDLHLWPLTEKGRAAQSSYDQTLNPQIDCIPVAAPSLMLYSNIFEVRATDDFVEILFEWLDVERVIYLDDRGHPPADQLFHQGHSTGRWEGETLVVDTANFAEHGAGNAFQVPSGTSKHLTERLTLSDDGKRIDYEFELTDPEWLTETVTGSVIWDCRPDLEPQRIECNREVARRFLNRMTPSEQ
jgi:hypothetical protein